MPVPILGPGLGRLCEHQHIAHLCPTCKARREEERVDAAVEARDADLVNRVAAGAALREARDR